MADEQAGLQQEAQRIGLTNLSEKQLAQMAKAKAAAERMVNGVPRDFQPSEEPAHTFRANGEA